MDAFSIFCGFKNCDKKFVWMFSGGYGLVQNEGGEEFWMKLCDIRGL